MNNSHYRQIEVIFTPILQSFFCSILILFSASNLIGQTDQQKKMAQLSFMIGEWEGISTSFQNDSIVSQVTAHEKIIYNLDKHIITIDLQSETLQLHTVIYYDNKIDKYYYNVFYEGGAGKYLAEFIDEKLIVSPNENKRFIFQLTPEGNFQEYGEKLENGEWVKYFEDIFKRYSEE